jgi:hypothetical protein
MARCAGRCWRPSHCLPFWASSKSEPIIAELKSIAERLQAEPGWENLDTQSPVAVALCIPLDGPCSQYAYRWDAHRIGMRRLPTS